MFPRPSASRFRPAPTTIAAGLLLSSLAVLSCSAGDEPPYREVVGTRLLMSGLLEPAADVVWDSVATVMTKEGTEEIRPETEEEWIAVRNAAVVVGEAGNLMMTPRRRQDEGDWVGWSLDLVDAGRAAMIAAESRDADALFDAGGLIYESCTGCHTTYWAGDPAAGFPELAGSASTTTGE